MKRFLPIATAVGYLVEEKNAAYGDSISSSGTLLQLIYPDGITLEQMDDALLVARVFDKLKRVATNRDALGESPWLDIAGYAILGLELSQRNEHRDKNGDKAVPAAGLRKVGEGKSQLLQRGMQGKRQTQRTTRTKAR